MNYVEHLDILGVIAKEIPCIKGIGAPSTSTVGAVGLLYMDINTGSLYKCTGVSDSTYTWEAIESGAEPKPNQKLTFTGAVDATYDGSEPIVVNIPSGGSGSVNQVQADWNENDSESKAYVQNRTHWTEGEKKEIYPEMTITAMAEDEPMAPFVEAPSFVPSVGDTVTVVWNGTPYKTKATLYTEEGIECGVMFGNVGAMIPGEEATNDPFLFVILYPELVDAMGAYAMCIFLDGSLSATISVELDLETVHKIDEKYLPIQKTHWVNEETVDIIKETIVSRGESIAIPATIENNPSVNTEYLVIIDGAPFKTLCYAIGEGTFSGAVGFGNTDSIVGGTKTEDTFGIVILSSMNASLLGGNLVVSGIHDGSTISIVEPRGTIHRIDEKFMPLSFDSALSFNNLKNGTADGSVRGIGSSDENDDYTIGEYAFAIGDNTKALGYSSYAEGHETVAESSYGHAEGECTNASGVASHAEGRDTNASGESSHAEGGSTSAFGESSHAEGEGLKSSIILTVLSGSNKATFNKYDILPEIGDYVTIDGGTSIWLRQALLIIDVDENSKTITFSDVVKTVDNKSSSGTFSVSLIREGAIGRASHSEGNSTTARGEASHAEGIGTIASGVAQHAQGKYNAIDAEGRYLHIVGNGESSANRSNAHTLDLEGNAWFAGKVYAGGTGMDDASELVSVHQGVANAGKILMVDANGNLTLADMPAGSSGDIVGVIDENHNIVLTGVLPEGLYSVKYQMEDGTLQDIGNINLESEQVINVTLSLGKIDYNNNGAIVASDTYLYSDVIDRNTNYSYRFSYIGEGSRSTVRVVYYDANGNYIGISNNVNPMNGDGNYIGSWSVPLITGAAKFRLRIYHENTTLIADTMSNFVVTKHRINYTNNVLATAVGTDGKVLDGVGYRDGYTPGSYPDRYRESADFFQTGFFPYTGQQAKDRVPIYVKGVTIDLTNLASGYSDHLCANLSPEYNTTDWVGHGAITDMTDANHMVITQLGEKYYMFKPNESYYTRNAWNTKGIKYMHMGLPGSGAGVIITVDEPIE